MNKQEIGATKAELSEVSEKIDLVNEKMDRLMMMSEAAARHMDSLIYMVNLIDCVAVDAKSNFARSSYKFVMPSDDLLGLLEPEVPAVSSQPEVPEVTELRV